MYLLVHYFCRLKSREKSELDDFEDESRNKFVPEMAEVHCVHYSQRKSSHH